MKKGILLLLCLINVCCFSFYTHAQIIKTIAGNGTDGFSGDGLAATTAQLNYPWGVAVDNGNNVYIADYLNSCIRKINSTTGIITTIAGIEVPYYNGDGGPATAAALNDPQDVVVTPAGIIYIADAGNNVIRKISASGIITTVAGNGTSGFSGDNGPADSAQLDQPTGIAVDRAGNLYIADYNNYRVRKVDTFGVITTIAGNGVGMGGGTGGYTGDGGPAVDAELFYPTGVAVDKTGNIYIADYENNAVRKVTPLGIITTVAGNGIAGFSGDYGPATAAKLSTPSHVTLDTVGNLYIADLGNNRIRKVNTLGIITSIAGTGPAGFSGDYGNATSASLNNPEGIAADGAGRIYIADEDNFRVRMISSTSYYPAFISGAAQSVSVCENSLVNSLDSLLSIRDTDIGQTETWTLSSGPSHGTVSGLSASATSNGGGAIMPSGINYIPATGYSGSDVFTIKISDGRITAATTIHVTVNPLPFAGTITGPSNVCGVAPIYLYDVVPGGLWSVSDTFISITGAGVVYALAPGADTVNYSVTNECGTATARKAITINPLADAGIITVPDSLCLGDMIRLTDASFTTVIDTGGLWYTSNSAASFNPGTGFLTALTADTFTLYIKVYNNCDTSIASETIRIDSIPQADVILGFSTLCQGYLILLTDSGTGGGIWNTSDSALATVNDGLVFAVAGGVDTISYTIANACSTATANKRIVINSLPVAGTITGPDQVCVGATINLLDIATGGVWSPSNSFAAVTGSGEVLGLSPGIDTISYIVTNSCGTVSAKSLVTVDPFSAGTIIGNDTVCETGYDTLSETLSGGAWSSEYTSLATINGAGIISGIAPGVDSIFYSVTNSCGTAEAIQLINVISREACGLENGVKAVASPLATDLNIYPNPTEGLFTLELTSDKDQPLQIVISNASGEKIKEFSTSTNKKTEIEFKEPAGIYFLSATTATGIYMAKILVN